MGMYLWCSRFINLANIYKAKPNFVFYHTIFLFCKDAIANLFAIHKQKAILLTKFKAWKVLANKPIFAVSGKPFRNILKNYYNNTWKRLLLHLVKKFPLQICCRDKITGSRM